MPHVFYGFHYARLYYQKYESEHGSDYRKGLIFPENVEPDYIDFLYFAFTIAMCYQTPDVAIRGRKMRHATLIHAMLSFLFVTGILGLVVRAIARF